MAKFNSHRIGSLLWTLEYIQTSEHLHYKSNQIKCISTNSVRSGQAQNISWLKESKLHHKFFLLSFTLYLCFIKTAQIDHPGQTQNGEVALIRGGHFLILASTPNTAWGPMEKHYTTEKWVIQPESWGCLDSIHSAAQFQSTPHPTYWTAQKHSSPTQPFNTHMNWIIFLVIFKLQYWFILLRGRGGEGQVILTAIPYTSWIIWLNVYGPVYIWCKVAFWLFGSQVDNGLGDYVFLNFQSNIAK